MFDLCLQVLEVNSGGAVYFLFFKLRSQQQQQQQQLLRHALAKQQEAAGQQQQLSEPAQQQQQPQHAVSLSQQASCMSSASVVEQQQQSTTPLCNTFSSECTPSQQQQQQRQGTNPMHQPAGTHPAQSSSPAASPTQAAQQQKPALPLLQLQQERSTPWEGVVVLKVGGSRLAMQVRACVCRVCVCVWGGILLDRFLRHFCLSYPCASSCQVHCLAHNMCAWHDTTALRVPLDPDAFLLRCWRTMHCRLSSLPTSSHATWALQRQIAGSCGR